MLCAYRIKVYLLTSSFMPVVNSNQSDMKFTYCAVCVSYILDDWTGINEDKVVQYITESMVSDGFEYFCSEFNVPNCLI